jgi:hypothetical protein
MYRRIKPLGPSHGHDFEQLVIWAPSRFQLLYLGLFVFSVNGYLFVSTQLLSLFFFYSLTRISVGCSSDVTGDPWL